MRSSSTHYVFGYGSLIDSTSRKETIPHADLELSIPALVHSLQRGWFVHSSKMNAPTTYLAVADKTGAVCNGALFEVFQTDLPSLDRRETNYLRRRLKPDRLQILDNHSRFCPSKPIWYYTARRPKEPTRDFPILRSYLNICLNGCFELEERFSGAASSRFTERFLDTTDGWSVHFDNDRDQPKRPHRDLRFHEQIESLLLKRPPVWNGGILD